MNIRPKPQPFLTSTPAWVLAFLTMILSTLFLFGVAYPLEHFRLGNFNIGEWIAHVSTGIGIAAACYFIGKHHPREVWYVPFLANAFSFLAAFIEPNFWITPMWKLFMTIWMFSAIATWLGYRSGNKINLHSS